MARAVSLPVSRGGWAEWLFKSPGVPLPVLVGFREEILPVLIAYWVVATLLYLLYGREWAFPVAVWATVTTIMLWPVGRRLGRPYLTYRTPLFILGVLSMAYIPFLGFALETDWSFTTKALIFFGAIADLTLFAIVPSLRAAITRPIEMFFKPDLLFGDGRVLCCGIISLVAGMRYMFGPIPVEPFPLPVWNWWGILLAMLAGFIPMIPIRGMVKLRMRMAGMMRDRWQGWGAVILREAMLVLFALGIVYGFMCAFLGFAPFTWSPWGFLWVMTRGDWAGAWTGIAIMVLSAVFLVVIRGGYKKVEIGAPFTRETTPQTVVKQLLLLAGLIPLFYGFIVFMTGQLRPLNSGPALAVGLPCFLWGVIVLGGFRVLAQLNQRRAIMEQMMTMVVPLLDEATRQKILRKNMLGFAAMPERERRRMIRTMLEIFNVLPEEKRKVMLRSRLEVMADLPDEARRVLLKAMDDVILGTA